MFKLLQKNVLYIAWLQALVATSGSLIFSEILKFPPCILCWYQRIAMYPLVAILAIGILKKDKNVAWYALPLSVVGLLIGMYHNLLYYKLLPESNAPCVLGVSCTTKFIEWFGFVTIPFLSTLAFLIITVCLVFFIKSQKSK